uniref:Adenylosuccinate synthetase n=1 Tax=Candidatus Kentrum sp. MB TaxID=2138164 RepID=A0A450X041_9GAMM|nr:MAG: adenylosuccinate synthase [Candidatus Kentron sp. MB]VFK32147.1 MAG: adenylosuccinate synthase [Candidatus Kentron sp. MB]VFK74171.1 MAG: adenylosuccinate synthase [Candidatus Kentron sp. MB]
MPISIVVGGQYGSEGKGKVAHYLAHEMGASFAVRCGGPNSGHTVIDLQGEVKIFQQLPTASILPDVRLAICAGSYLDLKILLKEIHDTGIDSNRLFIDPDAVVITDELKHRETLSGLTHRIGSTGSGTGAAVAARINREQSLSFARDIKELSGFIQDVPDVLRKSLDKQERIIIEGTQGFGLSPLHARHHPFVTSRDTTAAAFLAETGLSPFDVDDIVLTIRAFPIRVAGNSGPLLNEIDWKTITREGNHPSDLEERTSVSKKIRRVGRFSPNIVARAIKINQPNRIVLNHLDYVEKAKRVNLLTDIEKKIGCMVDFLGVSPGKLLQRIQSSRLTEF